MHQHLLLDNVAAPVAAEAPLAPVAVRHSTPPAMPLAHAVVVIVVAAAAALRTVLAAPASRASAAAFASTAATTAILSASTSTSARRATSPRTASVPTATTSTITLEDRHQFVNVDGSWHWWRAVATVGSLCRVVTLQQRGRALHAEYGPRLRAAASETPVPSGFPRTLNGGSRAAGTAVETEPSSRGRRRRAPRWVGRPPQGRRRGCSATEGLRGPERGAPRPNESAESAK